MEEPRPWDSPCRWIQPEPAWVCWPSLDPGAPWWCAFLEPASVSVERKEQAAGVGMSSSWSLYLTNHQEKGWPTSQTTQKSITHTFHPASSTYRPPRVCPRVPALRNPNPRGQGIGTGEAGAAGPGASVAGPRPGAETVGGPSTCQSAGPQVPLPLPGSGLEQAEPRPPLASRNSPPF